MDVFFRAYQAKFNGFNVPTYFIESTAPDNVDDATPPPALPPEYAPYLSPVDSDQTVQAIAGVLTGGEFPNMVVMVHGFNNPQPDVLKMYTSAAAAIERDQYINNRNGLVCVGYRWPSEKMGQPTLDARKALPTLAGWILALGILIVVVSLPLYFLPATKDWIFNWLGRFGEHVFTLVGWTAAGLILTAILLRIIVYFRDNYRASNYGIPDLIQVIRAIDAEIMRQRESGGTKDAPRVQLSFIGHSMGGFVVTNAIRTLSDVFAVRVDALNSYGAVSSPDLRSAATAPGSAVPPADAPSRLIGEAFELKRFVLASPDIPAETLLSSRGNFLASVLSRFDEAYLFSNEGDEVLRQISTLANYFVFPAKGRDHGFRLGNVEILSRQFGMIGVRQQDFLRVLRIGDLTLQELYDTLEDARESRIGDNAPAPEQALLPKRFTYFDCTDYIDSSDPAKDERKNWRALLTFAKCSKQNDPQAKLPWYSHLHLLLAYVARGQKPNVHGGYFQGLLSQELIYRLACLGYAGTVSAYGSEAALSQACEQKQIRMLVSPLLRSAVTPPAPATQTMRPSRRMAPVPAPPPAQPPEQGAPLQVPDLVGMSVVDARAVAEKMPQLLLLEITRPATGSQPKGNVLSQMPAPGTAVAPRTSIEVVIAR